MTCRLVLIPLCPGSRDHLGGVLLLAVTQRLVGLTPPFFIPENLTVTDSWGML